MKFALLLFSISLLSVSTACTTLTYVGREVGREIAGLPSQAEIDRKEQRWIKLKAEKKEANAKQEAKWKAEQLANDTAKKAAEARASRLKDLAKTNGYDYYDDGGVAMTIHRAIHNQAHVAFESTALGTNYADQFLTVLQDTGSHILYTFSFPQGGFRPFNVMLRKTGINRDDPFITGQMIKTGMYAVTGTRSYTTVLGASQTVYEIKRLK